MSDHKKRVTVTIDPHLQAYAEGLVAAGKAESVSAVVNGALSERAARERRLRKRWDDLIATATPDDRARAERIAARLAAQDG